MYSKKVTTPENSSVNYLKSGIHENVFVKSVTLGTWTNGECADILFEDEKGSVARDRVFPFNYSGGKLSKKDKDGNTVALTEEEEQDSYLLRFKHIFKSVVGDEAYDKAISKAIDFKSFIEILSRMSKDVYKDSKPIRIMLVSKLNTKENKYYSIVPRWTNGFVEAMDSKVSMRFDKEKYGKDHNEKPKVEDNKPKASTDDNLPF